jgi:hypothetical protein
MDDNIDRLYAHLTARPVTPTVRELGDDDRRAYQAEAGRAYRQRQREALQAGSPQPTAPMVREALADAALALLATDGPGAEEIRRVLGQVFAGRVGVPGTVTARAKSGRLRPKLVKSR